MWLTFDFLGVTELEEDNTFSNFILLKNSHTPTIQVSIFKEKEDKGNGWENKKERGMLEGVERRQIKGKMM